MFDPYHKWLGIPKDQRPPTHYQLLGIAAGEADAEVIEEAAVRQTAHVRNYQIGPHAAEATRLLNEISHAKLTLLNPAKRKTYDEHLAKRSAAITTKAPAPQPVAVAAEPAFAFDEVEDRPPPMRRDVNIARPRRGNTALFVGLGVGGVAILLLAAVVVALLAHRTDVVKPAQVVKKEDRKEIKPILKIPDDPPENDPPVIGNKPPVIVRPPIVNPPPVNVGGVPLAGARNFKTRETQIAYLSVSPDGSKVAVSFLNPHVYEVATGKHLALFPPGRVGGIVKTPLAFAPDNRRLLYAYGSDPAAAVGDVPTGKILFNLPQEQVQYASALAVSPDGKRALAGYNHRLVYWDLENQKEIKSWAFKNYIVHAIAFTPDGSKAVTADQEGTIDYWDLEKLAQLRQHRNPNLKGIHSISMAPDGKSFAVGSKSLAIVELPTFTVKLINVPDDPSNHTAVAFFGKGKRLLTAGKNGLVHVIDLEQLRVSAWKGHTAEVSRIAVDAKERIAVSGDRSGTVFVWPLPEGPIVAAPGAGAAPKGMRQIVARGLPGAYAVAFLPDGKSFITGGLRVEHWDLNGTLIRQFAKRGSTRDLFYLSVAADGKRFAWGQGKDSPAVLEVDTGRELARIERNGDVQGVALAPDGGRVLAAFSDGSAVVWDVAGQKLVEELPNQLPPAHALGFVPHGKHALVAHISGKVQLLDTATWKPAAETMTASFPRGPAFTADGKITALSAGNRVWLLDSGNLQSRGQLRVNDVRQLAFCAKGQLLLTMSPAQQAIAVWDVAKQVELTRWGLPERCHSFAVDRQETLLLAVMSNGSAYTWPLPATPQEVVAGLPPAPQQAQPDAKVHDVPQEGLVIRDTLTPQDPTVLFAPGLMRPARTFSVKLQAGQRYRFDLEGPASLDPLLVIYHPTGDRFAFNDDGGGVGLNSRIQLLPGADGVYRVSAGTLTGQGGEFVLKISKPTQ